jgi:hypothetical protein
MSSKMASAPARTPSPLQRNTGSSSTTGGSGHASNPPAAPASAGSVSLHPAPQQPTSNSGGSSSVPPLVGAVLRKGGFKARNASRAVASGPPLPPQGSPGFTWMMRRPPTEDVVKALAAGGSELLDLEEASSGTFEGPGAHARGGLEKVVAKPGDAPKQPQ